MFTFHENKKKKTYNRAGGRNVAMQRFELYLTVLGNFLTMQMLSVTEYTIMELGFFVKRKRFRKICVHIFFYFSNQRNVLEKNDFSQTQNSV